MHQDMFICFLDYKKASGSVNCNKLMEILQGTEIHRFDNNPQFIYSRTTDNE